MTDIDDRPPAHGSATSDELPAEGEAKGHPVRLALLAGLVLLLGTLGGLPALVVVAAIVIMIFMHELGHYLTARAAGMKVTEFFIGFGPRIWSFRRGEIEYGLKAIPAGAYVRIIGMNNLDQVDPADEPRTYRQKSYPRRLSVAVAGSAMHFLMALVLAFVALWGYGEVTAQSERNWTIGEVSTAAQLQDDYAGVQTDDALQQLLDEGETPASAAGLREGDRVIAADGRSFEDFRDFQRFVRTHPGDTVTMTVVRDGEQFTTDVTLGELSAQGASMGVIGLAPEIPREQFGVVQAARQSVSDFGTIAVESVRGIARFFSPSGLSNFWTQVQQGASDEPADDSPVVGPSGGSSEDDGRIISIYGAARIGAQATSEEGVVALLRFLVLLNVFIGIFNLVPLLPLDGGHVAIATYERIREFGRRGRYHADVTKLLPLTYAVVLLLITVGVMALYIDVVNPIDLQ